jgi:hypothetical protein
MKLISDGVTISILILITMIIICHTMNYLYPKNKFENIPQPTNYNQIYYSNKNSKLCSNINTGGSISSNMLNQAEIPYDIISSCSDNLDSSSNVDSGGGGSGSGGSGSGGGGGTTPTITSGGVVSGTTPTITSGGGGSSTTPTITSGGGGSSTTPIITSGGGGSSTTPTKMHKYLNTLSESELAVLYKVLYENTEREIILRTLNDM